MFGLTDDSPDKTHSRSTLSTSAKSSLSTDLSSTSSSSVIDVSAASNNASTPSSLTESESTNTQRSAENEDDASLTRANELVSLFSVKAKQQRETVETLTIFMFRKLCDNNLTFVLHFESLVKLEIIFCELSSIEGLSQCNLDNLNILNLSNNNIKKLDGIQSLINLTELHIGENEIDSLHLISHCPNLTVLDFHDNLVEDIEPIIHCTQLQIIRAGNNKINTIRNYLDGMNELQFLNLAGNNLLHFDEIDILSTIPKLTHLQLKFCLHT